MTETQLYHHSIGMLMVNATELAQSKGFMGVAVLNHGGAKPFVAGTLSQRGAFSNATFNEHQTVQSALQQLIGQLVK